MGVALNYDATPPAVAATLARAPDSNGWFNHPVAAIGTGSDGASGVAGCTSASYGGPDTAGVSLAVSCRDRAGNGSGAQVSLKYDASPPEVVATPDRPPVAGGWYRRLLTVSFRRGRRDLRRRLVYRPGSLQRSGQHVGARGRKLPRRGRQYGRGGARLQVRRDGAARECARGRERETADRRPLGTVGGRRDVRARAHARSKRGTQLDRLQRRGPAVRRQGGARRGARTATS